MQDLLRILTHVIMYVYLLYVKRQMFMGRLNGQRSAFVYFPHAVSSVTSTLSSPPTLTRTLTNVHTTTLFFSFSLLNLFFYPTQPLQNPYLPSIVLHLPNSSIVGSVSRSRVQFCNRVLRISLTFKKWVNGNFELQNSSFQPFSTLGHFRQRSRTPHSYYGINKMHSLRTLSIYPRMFKDTFSLLTVSVRWLHRSYYDYT